MTVDISLPQDWGLHPDARSEWWYFTGRLVDNSGARWSYMLSFFRSSFSMELSRFAHFLLFSADAGVSVACERALSPFGHRPRIGREGVDIDYDGWTASLADDVFQISANYRDFGIDLRLSMGEPMRVGKNGCVDVGRIRTSAFSLPRLETRGEIRVAGRSREVTGTSWFDHEWGAIPLPHCWHWWGINLEDGSDLVLREARGECIANLRTPDGVDLTSTSMNAAPTRFWPAPRGGLYPVDWTVGLPEFGLELAIRSERENCETPFRVVYWEGLCEATARKNGTELKGRGYMELVGYSAGMLRFVVTRLSRLAVDLLWRDRQTDYGHIIVSEVPNASRTRASGQ